MSRQSGYVLVAVVLGALVAGCATTEEKTEVRRLQARAAYERGWTHIQQKEAALALSAIQQAIALDPSVPVYWNAMGWILLDRGRPDAAYGYFAKAVELDPTYADAQINLGVALAEMRRWEEALAAYQKALALPTVAQPYRLYHNLGLALYHLKRYREAEQALRFAIGLEPKIEGSYYVLGLVLVAVGRHDEARALFQRSRDLAPQSVFGRAAAERLEALGASKSLTPKSTPR